MTDVSRAQDGLEAYIEEFFCEHLDEDLTMTYVLSPTTVLVQVPCDPEDQDCEEEGSPSSPIPVDFQIVWFFAAQIVGEEFSGINVCTTFPLNAYLDGEVESQYGTSALKAALEKMVDDVTFARQMDDEEVREGMDEAEADFLQ